MTQRTKAGLQTNLNTDLADNSTGDISAADVRGNLIDFTDSVPFLSTADNTLSGSFSGSFQGDGSNLTGVVVTTADTASSTPNALTTASVSSNVITFTKGDASTFNITVDTGSAGGGSTFPYTGSAGISGSLDVVGDFTVDVASGASYNSTTGSILVANLELLGNESALMRGRVNTEIRGESFYDANPALPGNVTIANSLGFGSTKGYTKIDAGDLYMSGSTINSTGSWTHEGPTVLSGSLEVSGSVTIGRQGGLGHDLGVYSIETASFQVDYLDMELYESTVLNALSIGSTQGNFEIKNTAQFGGTKGYIKLNAGDLLITGSAVYIKPSSLPTSEPSDSGQLWLSGSAGNSKYLMVRD